MNSRFDDPDRAVNSLFRYSPALVLIAIMIVDSSRVADGDLWGHLRFGQDVLRSGHVMLRDPYAYSAPGRPWVSHEWLSEVIIAFSYNHAGVIGLKLMKLGCSAATVIFLTLAMAETGASTLTQFAILILAGLRLSPQMQFRPQIFSYALLAATLALIARDNFGRRAPLWLLVPLFALWANLHGGFVVGLGALGVYAAIAGADAFLAGNGIGRLMRLAALLAACALATLLTPYGVGTWTAVAHTLGNPGMIGVIDEWKPLLVTLNLEWHASHASLVYDVPILLIYGGLLVSVLLAPRGGDLALTVIAAIMIAASFMAVRNVPLGLIAAAVPLARHFTIAVSASRSHGEASEPAAESNPAHESLVSQAVITVAAIALALQTGLFSNRLRLDADYPAGAVNFMHEHGLAGNILCHYHWCDYVLYHCAPPSHLFIDSRYEMIYPKSVTSDFVDFVFDRAGAAPMLAKYPHEFVLIPPNGTEARTMAHADGWRSIYEDRVSMLYAKAGGRIAAKNDTPVVGVTGPAVFP